MNNEKMAILKMLEDKKISAEEAAKLLEAVGKTAGAPPREPARSSGSPYPPNQSNPSGGAGGRGGSVFDRFDSVESFAEEMGRKLGTLARDLEPKIQKFAGVAVEKTAAAADSLSKSFTAAKSEEPAARRPEQPAAHRPAPHVSRGAAETSFEMKVTEAHGELNLSGLNGQVLIKGYNGDKISAKVSYSAKRPGAKPELTALGSKFFLNYDENDFERVSIDAFVPEAMFDNVRISTSNGAAVVSSVQAVNVKIQNSGGAAEVEKLRARNVILDSTNGNLRLNDIRADKACFETFNGSVSAASLDVEQLKIATFNGAVTLQASAFKDYSTYDWALECSNERLAVMLPSSPSVGYAIKAHSALGQVKIGLVGLSYTKNEKSYAEAQSFNFDECSKKVNLYLQTSNANLTVD